MSETPATYGTPHQPADMAILRMQEIRKRADKATNGPWEASSNEHIVQVTGDCLSAILARDSGGQLSPAIIELASSDAALIAHARQDIPYLLDELTAAHMGVVLEIRRTSFQQWKNTPLKWQASHQCRGIIPPARTLNECNVNARSGRRWPSTRMCRSANMTRSLPRTISGIATIQAKPGNFTITE